MIESTQQMIYAAIVFALVLPEAGRFLQHHAEYERRAGGMAMRMPACVDRVSLNSHLPCLLSCSRIIQVIVELYAPAKAE